MTHETENTTQKSDADIIADRIRQAGIQPRASSASPSIYPLLFERHNELMGEQGSAADSIRGATITALNFATGTLNEITDAQNAIVDEETRLTAGRSGMGGYTGDIRMVKGRPQIFSHRYNEFADAAEGAIDNALSKVKRQQEAIEAGISRIQRDVNAKMKDTKYTADVHREIRDHLKSMPKGTALETVQREASRGNTAFIHAVFGVPFALLNLKAQCLALVARHKEDA